MKYSILIFALIFCSCDPNKKQTPPEENTPTETVTKETTSEEVPKTIKEPKEVVTVTPAHYICYNESNNPKLKISISFDEEGKAFEVRYKGQSEGMKLEFIDEEMETGGANPNIIERYREIYEGKENGTYKLTHSGVWDYAEYTRGRDGKVFNFTIDHDVTIQGDTYRDMPCYE